MKGNAYKYGVLRAAGTKELELAKVARWDEQNFLDNSPGQVC
jgi:hypothetical protein